MQHVPNGQYGDAILGAGGLKGVAEQMQGMSLGPADHFSDGLDHHVAGWSLEEVVSWLHSNGLGELEPAFRQNDIKGPELARLQPDDVFQLGITKAALKKRLEDCLAQLTSLQGNKDSYDLGDMSGQPVKIFVGQIPKTASNDEVREMFEEFGQVVDCIVLRDKYTGESRGCGFVKYSTKEEGDAAIEALHNLRTMPPSTALLQVQYAHGETVHDGGMPQEYKLFVGQLPKDISEHEVTELFGAFGDLTEVCLLRHPDGNSKGCGFVKYSKRDAAIRAIAALSGKRKLEGAAAPLNIEFAETKREKQLKRLGIPRAGGLSIPMAAMQGANGFGGLIGGHSQPGMFAHPYQQLQQQRAANGINGGGPQGISNAQGGFGQFPLGPQVAPGFLA
eukprot:CAMPEP_0206271632 /NCGR_PEP_ID=MMETSP0047_2-20121206/33538_1 /ASSEMBLY_ACC=CAM_ASM_000192 /TAXON_ID=195065 /ORGANISM="Chroomonas mesostigmatica_cf, Strain CCMP1168" /LENGTH=390 /DNA_ID=CAMNT_0053700419 /DNA_START=106 /DNA_END=1275 /DNA_ORIENTATION=-